jgi:hypothetical protein
MAVGSEGDLSAADYSNDEGEWPEEEIGEPFNPETMPLPFEEL